MSPTAESAVLVTCARASLDAHQVDHLRGLLAGPLDWPALLDRARWHGIMPLLYHHIRATGLAAPPDALARLRSHFVANARRNLHLGGELVRLLALLRERGIVAVALKGPLLAVAAYGDIALRQFQDLDILVQPHELTATRATLREAGYAPEEAVDPRREPASRRWRCAEEFVDRRRQIAIDVHWDIVPRVLSVEVDRAWLLDGVQPLAFAGAQVPVLATGPTILFLCIHGGKHCWDRLEWIAALAEILRRRRDVPWTALEHHARRAGACRLLYLGLHLAHALLDAPLPPAVAAAAASDPGVGRLAQKVLARLVGGPCAPRSIASAARFQLAARERGRDRARYGLRLALAPTVGDWNTVALPRPLSGAYYLLRPARLAFKYLCRFPNSLHGRPHGRRDR